MSETAPMLPAEARERMSEYLDGALSPAERSAFEAALRNDPALRHELDELRETVGHLKALASVVPPSDLEARVRSRVRQASKERRLVRFINMPAVRITAAAALLLIVVRLSLVTTPPRERSVSVALSPAADREIDMNKAAEVPRLAEAAAPEPPEAESGPAIAPAATPAPAPAIAPSSAPAVEKAASTRADNAPAKPSPPAPARKLAAPVTASREETVPAASAGTRGNGGYGGAASGAIWQDIPAPAEPAPKARVADAKGAEQRAARESRTAPPPATAAPAAAAAPVAPAEVVVNAASAAKPALQSSLGSADDVPAHVAPTVPQSGPHPGDIITLESFAADRGAVNALAARYARRGGQPSDKSELEDSVDLMERPKAAAATATVTEVEVQLTAHEYVAFRQALASLGPVRPAAAAGAAAGLALQRDSLKKDQDDAKASTAAPMTVRVRIIERRE